MIESERHHAVQFCRYDLYTHVLVNDPTMGYGIFIENMLETAQSVTKEQKIKNAS